MARDDTIIDQAIAWHVRQADLREDEWPGFVAWLEADPAHAHAYDAVALQDDAISVARFAPAAANDDPGNDDTGHHRHWPRWLGTAAVAAGFALVSVALIRPAAVTPKEIATGPGESRTLALADGTRIELSGDTRLAFAGNAARSINLVRGEVTLHVRHDAAHPFELVSGAVTLRDLGTVFNVARVGQRLEVQVAEGAVLFQPRRDPVTLRPGDSLVVREDLGSVTRGKVIPALVGGWRTGMLSFDNEPLAGVVAAIHRLHGTDIALTARLSRQPFTGMIHLTGAADRDIPHLAALIGADWRRDGEHWVLGEKTAPSR